MARRRRSRGLSYLPPGPGRTPSIIYILLAAALLGGIFYTKQNMVKSVAGEVIDAYTGQPIADAVVTIKNDPRLARTSGISGEISLKTDQEGHFSFPQATDKYSLKVEALNYRNSALQEFNQTYTAQFRLKPYILRGVVKDEMGSPIARAGVTIGERTVYTGPEGDYQFVDAPESGKLVVKATGFRRNTPAFDKTIRQDVELKTFRAKGIYLSTPNIEKDFIPNLVNLVDSTELNTIVMDMKDESGQVFFDSNTPLAKVAPDNKGRISDLPGLLKTFHEHNIYAIARMAVFLDPVLTDAKPEWALKSRSNNNKLWTDADNYNWSNPYTNEVWDYNLNLAKEMAQAGFDEIQFDYLRFPTSGNLNDIEYSRSSDANSRIGAVNGFLKRARAMLTPYGVFTSVNVFGLVALQTDDLGIGTRLEDLADQVDYISPTLYPSSWGKGTFGIEQPATKPFDVIRNALINARPLVQGRSAQLRPWLQDFSLDGINYGSKEVREQIRATEQPETNTTGGWLLWNSRSRYTVQALNPKSDTDIRNNATTSRP